MKVADIMTREVTTVNSDSTLRDAAVKMRENNIGSLVVASDSRAIGVVTDRDLTTRALAQDWVAHEHRINEVMTGNPVTINENADILDAAGMIGRNRVRRLPVVSDDGRLVGLVSEADVTEYLGRALTDIFGEMTKAEK